MVDLMSEDLWSYVADDAIPTMCKYGCGPIKVVLSRSAQHIRADCPRCGKYQKFVRQNLPADERAHWDERKAWRSEQR